MGGRGIDGVTDPIPAWEPRPSTGAAMQHAVPEMGVAEAVRFCSVDGEGLEEEFVENPPREPMQGQTILGSQSSFCLERRLRYRHRFTNIFQLVSKHQSSG